MLIRKEQKNLKATKLVGSSGIEPPTSRLSGVRSNRLSYEPTFFGQNGVRFVTLALCGGDEEDRTPDPLLARQVLSQLSYTPISRVPVTVLPLLTYFEGFGPSKLNNER